MNKPFTKKRQPNDCLLINYILISNSMEEHSSDNALLKIVLP